MPKQKYIPSKFYLKSKNKKGVVGPFDTVKQANAERVPPQQVYAGKELNGLEADAMYSGSEIPQGSALGPGYVQGREPSAVPFQFNKSGPSKNLALSSRTTQRQRALAKKGNKSPRQVLLSHLMKGFSGDNGDKVASAFIGGDKEAFKAAFDAVGETMLQAIDNQQND